MIKILLIIPFGLLLNFVATAQNLPVFPNQTISDFLNNNPSEIIYINVDREIYSTRDTIYLKAYILDLRSKIPIQKSRNIWVELISPNNKIIIKHLLQSKNGFATASIALSPNNLVNTTYTLRAYSDFQRNLSNELFYSQPIEIKKVITDNFEPIFIKPSNSEKLKKTSQINVQFLPESGHLCYNVVNNLAFHATESTGKPVRLDGYIINNTTDKKIPFRTNQSGQGKIKFNPIPNQEYSIHVYDHPNIKLELPEAYHRTNIRLLTGSDSIYSFKINRSNKHIPQSYYLAVASHGQIQFYATIGKTQTYCHFQKELFDNGINTVTLFNTAMEPIAERLVFKMANEIIDIQLETKKEYYHSKAKVHGEISTSFKQQGIATILNIEAVNTDQVFQREQYPRSLISYAYLEHEIRGEIHNPSQYFIKDSISESDKIDLLMLTQGWRSYTWNELEDSLPKPIYGKSSGITLNGTVEHLLGNSGVKNGQVSILIKDNQNHKIIKKCKTNTLGQFSLNSLYFNDSASVFIQGLNKRNRNTTEIKSISTFPISPPIELNNIQYPTPWINPNAELFNNFAYKRIMDDKLINPENYEHLIEEVLINETYDETFINADGNFRIHGSADNVLIISEQAQSHYNIWRYISSMVPSMYVRIINGEEVPIIRGVGSTKEYPPLCSINGSEVTYREIEYLNMAQIEKVEVLTSAGNTSIYGVKGANGVIAVYLKNGSKIKYDDKTGIMNTNLRGYHVSKEFYSPAYESTSDNTPDHRATLHWNPELITNDKGEASFEFYTSDDASPCIIKVEGITADGKIGMGFATVHMTGKRISNKMD